MRKLVFVILLSWCSLGTLISQTVINVSGEYTYHAPINISIEEAKSIALQRAKIQCLADEFGTTVNQSNSTIIHTVDGEGDVSNFSLGATEVKGEWLGDWKQPIYKIRYDELSGGNIVYVQVFGKVRAISGVKVDVSAKILCNGFTPRHEREIFFEGDPLYMSFLTPVDGYLSVYLIDEEANAYCLLPYESSADGIEFVSANKNHIFFSKQMSEQPEWVDEYVMSCARDGETNLFYIIYSPNKFTKPADHASSASLRQLSYQKLQEWLLDAQTKDPQMQVVRKSIIIKKME